MNFLRRLQWFSIIAIVLGLSAFVVMFLSTPHAVVLALLGLIAIFLAPQDES